MIRKSGYWNMMKVRFIITDSGPIKWSERADTETVQLTQPVQYHSASPIKWSERADTETMFGSNGGKLARTSHQMIRKSGYWNEVLDHPLAIQFIVPSNDPKERILKHVSGSWWWRCILGPIKWSERADTETWKRKRIEWPRVPSPIKWSERADTETNIIWVINIAFARSYQMIRKSGYWNMLVAGTKRHYVRSYQMIRKSGYWNLIWPI